jgi:predicted lipoprotein with Yx(FWY)xxD motif
MRRSPVLALALPVVTAALIVAGCGGSSNKSSGTSSGGGTSSAPSNGGSSSTASGGYGGYGGYGKPSSSSSSSATSAAVVKGTKTKLGTILAGPDGRTLYLFQKDTGPQSTCTGSCTAAWPPLTTKGSPKASGLNASLLSTTKRSDGTTQVVYGGHPLYYYAGDQSAGQTNGEGLNQFGAEWDVLRPSGKMVAASG